MLVPFHEFNSLKAVPATYEKQSCTLTPGGACSSSSAWESGPAVCHDILHFYASSRSAQLALTPRFFRPVDPRAAGTMIGAWSPQLPPRIVMTTACGILSDRHETSAAPPNTV